MSQSDMILAYMIDHGSITPKEAMDELGCMRLGARIFDLKRAGHEIHMEYVQERNRFGKMTCFARYSLEGNG